MSIQAVAWALDQDIRDPLAKLILISLGNHADHSTGFCWPPMRLIAKEASCDRRSVIRKLPWLVDTGYIRIIPDMQGKQRLAHYYQLLMPGCDPQSQPPPKKQNGSVAKQRPIVTRGYDPRVSTKNHQTTITSPLPPSPPPERAKQVAFQRKEVGREGRPTGERPETVQNHLAKRLGLGDVAHGWEMLGQLSDSERDQLTAQQRTGRLDEATLLKICQRLSAKPP